MLVKKASIRFQVVCLGMFLYSAPLLLLVPMLSVEVGVRWRSICVATFACDRKYLSLCIIGSADLDQTQVP